MRHSLEQSTWMQVQNCNYKCWISSLGHGTFSFCYFPDTVKAVVLNPCYPKLSSRGCNTITRFFAAGDSGTSCQSWASNFSVHKWVKRTMSFNVFCVYRSRLMLWIYRSSGSWQTAMAQKANAAKNPNTWGFGFFETSGFSWVSFAIVIGCALTFVYLLQSLVVSRGKCISRSVHTLSTMVTHSDPSFIPPEHRSLPSSHATELSRVVFGIAGAAKNLPNRKEYIKRWYNLEKSTRAIVWLDHEVNGTWEKDHMPPFKISEDISDYPFNLRKRTATRIARIVSETFRLGLLDVDWFVMGDDDTFFFPENAVKVLSKYDHTKMYYIGSNSETHTQNLLFSFNMAFGGGGFAISYPLAEELAKMQDSCLAR